MKTLEKIIKSVKCFGRTALFCGALAINSLSGCTTTLTLEDEVKASKANFWIEAPSSPPYVSKNIMDSQTAYVPLIIRDVPAHPDDPVNPANVAPIEPDIVELSEIDNPLPWVVLGGKFNFKRFRLGIGAGISDDNITEEIHKRNYTNAPGTDQTGYGAALTYYKVNSGMFPFQLGLESEILLSKNSTIALGSFFAWGYVDASNGWDRYNSLESWHSYSLIDYKIRTPYLSFRKYWNIEESNLYFALNLGLVEVFDKEYTALGRQTGIEINDGGYFATLRFGIEK